MVTPPEIPDHRLVRPIGRGSYGEVWLAITAFETLRAVKVVRRAEFADPAPYQRELAGIRKFEPVSRNHPGLIDILHVGTAPDESWFYYVMEAADDASSEGTGVDAYVPLTLRRRLESRGLLNSHECLELGLKLAEAIEYLHANGLVHRDVKPSNVVFVGGQPKLADGGLVASHDEARSDVGTRTYCPPEGAGTPSGDCYSLGRLLHEAATGNLRSIYEAPTDLGDRTDREAFLELQEILFRACAVRIEERYPSAGSMRRDFQRVLGGDSLRKLRRERRRAQVLSRVCAATLILAGVLCGAWWHESRRGTQMARLEARARAHLVQLHLANAGRALGDGSWNLAQLWLTKALETTPDSDQAEDLRWQIGALRSAAPRVVALGIHHGSINEVAFHPGGKRFAVAGADGIARIHETQDGKPIGEPLRHESAINDVRFSPDGGAVSTAGDDGTLRIWDSETGTSLLPPIPHGSPVWLGGFSPDGRLLFGACDDGRIRVWNRHTGEECFPAIRHGGRVRWVEFSPDGRWILSAGYDGLAVVWNVRSGEPRFPPLVHSAPVKHAAFDPDGLRFVTACADGVVRFWNAETGAAEEPVVRHLSLNYAGFSHDGRYLVTTTGATSEPSEARIWDASNGQPVGLPVRHEARIRYAEFSPDDRWLATASHDGVVHVVPVGTSGEGVKFTHASAVWALSFSPDGQRLLTGGRDPVWKLWDLGSHRTSPWELPEVGLNDFTVAQISDDLTWLWARSSKSSRLWRLEAGQEIPRPIGQPEAVSIIATDFQSRRALVSTTPGVARILELTTWKWAPEILNVGVATFTRDGSRIFLAQPDHTLGVFSASDGSPEAPPVALAINQNREIVFTLSPDGTRLAICQVGDPAESSGFLLIDTALAASVGEGRVIPQGRYLARFSPDSSTIALGCRTPESNSGMVEFIDARTGQPTLLPLVHPHEVTALAFTPDGQLLATGDIDGFVRLWDLRTGSLSRTFPRQPGSISRMDCSPDGQRLATGCLDGSVIVWSISTGRPCMPPLQHRGAIWSVQFHKDGRWLLTASRQGDVRIWMLNQVTESLTFLRAQAELNSGLFLRDDGDVEALSPEALSNRWVSLSGL